MRRSIVRRAAVTGVLALLSACSATVAPAPTASGWHQLPPPPLSPRALPVVAWVGGEVVVLGGDTAPVCPPSASCTWPSQPQRDGAAYDLAAGTWRRTAPAPRPVVGDAVVVGDVVWTQSGFAGDAPLLAYDVSENSWTVHPAPPGVAADAWDLAVSGSRLVALRSQEHSSLHDAIYDSRTRRWRSLPPNTLPASFDRAAVDTAYGLLVVGLELVDQPNSSAPALLRAELLDATGAWHRLPDSDQLAGVGIAVHGSKAVFPDLGGADGGATHPWGRRVPSGGVLDLATRRWSRLPHPPEEGTGGWPVFALGGPVSASAGWLFDVEQGAWTRLARPDGAPALPGPAVWAEDRLVVIGGSTRPGAGALQNVQGAWMLTP